jgi:hypothetical protein
LVGRLHQIRVYRQLGIRRVGLVGQTPAGNRRRSAAGRLTGDLRTLFELTRLDALFPLYATRADALAARELMARRSPQQSTRPMTAPSETSRVDHRVRCAASPRSRDGAGMCCRWLRAPSLPLEYSGGRHRGVVERDSAR